MKRSIKVLWAGWIGIVLCGQAWAVKPTTIKHEEPKDFTDAKLEQVVVSSRGEVSLAREVDILKKVDTAADVINAIVRAGDGKFYAASGPAGVIFRVDGDEVEEFAELPEPATIFSLLFTRDGKLLAGTGGGEQAKVYLIDGTGKARLFYEPADAKYIWAMARGAKGEIYMATGIKGQLHVVDEKGQNGKVLADMKIKNLLCLAVGPDGKLYVGTDEEGLIARVDPDSGEIYVLYDANEPEISAVVLDAEGNVYASTADASAARPGQQVADAPPGHPELSDTSDDDQGKSESQPADKNSHKTTTTSPTTTQAQRKKLVGQTISDKKPGKDGNAIYRINLDGFVTEVFRESVMILDLAESDGTIYVSTGNEGRIYAVNPVCERTTMLARLEASQATCLLRTPDGQLVVGTANAAMLVRLEENFATEGTLVSEPIDAKQIVHYGRIKWQAEIPQGTGLTVATRSGNVKDEESKAWEDWSNEMDASTSQQIPSAPGRFLQYRLTFKTQDSDQTPSLNRIELSRLEENRAPVVDALKVLSASEAMKESGVPGKVKAALGGSRGSDEIEPDYKWVALWKAEDPNEDKLTYKVYFRELGQKLWIRMAKELDDSFHVWDTRTMPDGRYEIRVEAGDAADNPKETRLTAARISDPITVDNTEPQIRFKNIDRRGDDGFRISADLSDSASSIQSAAYSIDSSEDWVPLAADDDIFDSMNESVTFDIEDLEPGPHRLALRVSDSQGNTRYAARALEVVAP